MMYYTKRTRRAMEICLDAHKGQVDKGGFPYCFHPFHLAEKARSESECIVSLLHDVLEDSDKYSLETLWEELNLTFEEREALRFLTHEKGLTYFEYIKRLAHNDLARTIKMRDLHHNLDRKRLMGQKDEKRDAKRQCLSYLRDLERYEKIEKTINKMDEILKEETSLIAYGGDSDFEDDDGYLGEKENAHSQAEEIINRVRQYDAKHGTHYSAEFSRESGGFISISSFIMAGYDKEEIYQALIRGVNIWHLREELVGKEEVDEDEDENETDTSGDNLNLKKLSEEEKEKIIALMFNQCDEDRFLDLAASLKYRVRDDQVDEDYYGYAYYRGEIFLIDEKLADSIYECRCGIEDVTEFLKSHVEESRREWMRKYKEELIRLGWKPDYSKAGQIAVSFIARPHNDDYEDDDEGFVEPKYGKKI